MGEIIMRNHSIQFWVKRKTEQEKDQNSLGPYGGHRIVEIEIREC